MKSIRNKISLVILLCVLLSTWLVGFVSIVKLKKSISKDSVQIMNLLCSENAEKINSLFSRIERSVEILADYSVFNLKSVEKLESDKNYRAEYIKNIDSVGLTIAERTKGAVAVYVRFAPELTSTKSGFFRVKNYDTEKFDIEEAEKVLEINESHPIADKLKELYKNTGRKASDGKNTRKTER